MKRLKDLSGACARVKRMVKFRDVLDHYGVAWEEGPSRLQAICPFHDDHDPSLHVKEQDALFYCRACGEGGDLLQFVGQMESIPLRDAVHTAAGIGGVDLSDMMADPTPEELRAARVYAVNAEIVAALDWASDRAPLDGWIAERRLSEPVLSRFDVGYSSHIGAIDSLDLERAGINHRARPAFNHSVVIPLKDDHGRVAGFRARMLGDSPGRPKSMAPGDDHPLPLPPVYGFYEARAAARGAGYLVAVEGEVDCWQMHARGHANCVALMGAHLPESTLQWLRERGVRELVLMPDADDAGRKLVARVASLRDTHGVRIRVAWLPFGDPDEVLLSDPPAVDAALEGAGWVVEWAIRDLASKARDEAGVLDACGDVIAGLGMAERELACAVIADILHISAVSVMDHYAERSLEGHPELYHASSERDLLSMAMHHPESLAHAASRIHHGDAFWVPRHRRIWQTLRGMLLDGDAVTPESVRVRLRASSPEDIAHADMLWESRPSADGVQVLADALIDMRLRRCLMDESRRLAQSASDVSRPARDSALDVVSRVSSAAVGQDDRVASASQMADSFMVTMNERVANPRLIVGADLGDDFYTLNHAIHGLQAGRHVVVAAPSGVGKSMWAANWIRLFGMELAEPTLVLTFETGSIPYATRIICGMAGVEIEKVTTGFMSEEEYDLVRDAASLFHRSPIKITSAGKYVEDALALVRHDHMQRGTGLVVFDYVQLMLTREGSRLPRHEQIGLISGSILGLTEELQTRTLALAQINREGAKKARSSMNDVAGSFEIAQDADIFAVMDELTEAEIQADGLGAGNRSVIVPKNRVDGKSNFSFRMHADVLTQTLREVR